MTPTAGSDVADDTATKKYIFLGEVVVAQLAERSLTIPEDPGSIPVIGNFY